ncbi:MAG: hypothetical protein HKN27_16775 [Silicimonas sp.]|nr:hypothetical protein [Silicimonas sp.]
MDRTPITLTEDDKLAEGYGRAMYRFPGRADVIVKIHKPLNVKRFQWLRTLLRYNRWRFGDLLTTAIEINEFSAMVARSGTVPAFAAQFLGFVQTDLGPGALFEAVLTADGALAPHLKQHAWTHGAEPEIETAIDRLWDQIAAARAVVSDANLTNVLVTGSAEDGYQLTLVDGLGERALFKRLGLSDKAYHASIARGRVAMKKTYHWRAGQDGPSD